MGKECHPPEGREMEVTPAMIEAGLGELGFFDPAEDSPEAREEIVKAIYLAMLRNST